MYQRPMLASVICKVPTSHLYLLIVNDNGMLQKTTNCGAETSNYEADIDNLIPI